MNYKFGNDCAKALQEFRDLTKDFEDLSLWVIKYQNLYNKICKSGSDLYSGNDFINSFHFLIEFKAIVINHEFD